MLQMMLLLLTFVLSTGSKAALLKPLAGVFNCKQQNNLAMHGSCHHENKKAIQRFYGVCN